jgi:hypothetical protein
MAKCKHAEAASGQEDPLTLPNKALQTSCDPPSEDPVEQPLLCILFDFYVGLEAALNREFDPDPKQAPSATLFLLPLTPITPSEGPCNTSNVAELLQAVSDHLQQELQPQECLDQ